MNISQIKSIQFGIQGDEDIVRNSVCLVNKTPLSIEIGTVYDPRMGCIETNKNCVTCEENVWKCTGHFGHIELSIPIILFYKQVVGFLRMFCFTCNRLLITKEIIELHNLKGVDRIRTFITNRISFCCRNVNGTVCNTQHPLIKLDTADNIISIHFKYKNLSESKILSTEYIKMIFDNIQIEDLLLLDIDVKMFHPKNLVLTKFPVIPTGCRPRMITPENISDDDLSIMLVDIIKINNLLLKNTTDMKLRNLLKFKILTFCDNSRGKALHNTNRKPMVGIKERITKKSGHVRQNLMGKRRDFAARTVVGPDPTLRLNELAIPIEIASSQTIPVYVTPFNIEQVSKKINIPGWASILIKPDGVRISIPIAMYKVQTYLHHGDVVRRNNQDIEVKDCKMQLLPTDVIYRNTKIVPNIPKVKQDIVVQVGDIVERFLQDGDFVLMNRQPTLHRNSIQGMKVVVKPCKTFRLNLAIVTGFNMDFDGDEGNMFVQTTIESMAEMQYLSNAKYNILSSQCNKPDMVIVQDSLLGAYNMTVEIRPMTKADFDQCLMAITHDYNYKDRLAEILELRQETYLTCHCLFGFMFPRDFYYKTSEIEIVRGILKSGVFTKNSLKGGQFSLIRLLCKEYDENVVSDFIDNIQFLTNTWLELNPFSIGIYDCLMGNAEKKREIGTIVNKYFIEADNVSKTTSHYDIREARINCALNKAKDIGFKIAREALCPSNNFIKTVSSGSKGDYFNIVQIMGLLGQQNLDGKRPELQLDNKKRSLIHYPRHATTPSKEYRSRGFIVSSFFDGLQPDEMFFHAMTGREGMTKTSMGTATSGYIQRSIVKINEDLKIEYDGTVRDARKNIYQHVYGNNGFDPCKVDVDNDDCVHPINIERLATQLNNGENGSFLTEYEIEDIIDNIFKDWIVLNKVQETVAFKYKNILRDSLNKVKVCPKVLLDFKSRIIAKYNLNKATPGDCVGIIGAQSIGERQTQNTLNTFHTAGKLQQSGVGRLEEILSISKSPRFPMTIIYFKKKYSEPDQLRKDIGHSLKFLVFKNVYTRYIWKDNCITFILSKHVMFTNRIHPQYIATILKRECSCRVTIGSCSIETIFVEEINLEETLSMMNKIYISGIPNIENVYLDYDNEWFVVVEGNNLPKLLIHPLIDQKRLISNDYWEVYENLGIVAVRKMLWNDLRKVTEGINTVHIKLLIDKMTYRGTPCSISRYTMRTNEVGPLSKATFEESIDIILNAAIKTETETNSGVSASIISGNQPKVGTGFFDLFIDWKSLPDVNSSKYGVADVYG